MGIVNCPYIDDPSWFRKFDVRVAAIVGETAATFIQQVHYHAFWKKQRYKVLEWRSSLSEWEKDFPTWSLTTIRRTIKECRDIGVLKIRKQTNARGVEVWFSLDYDKLTEIGDAGTKKIEARLGQIEQEIEVGSVQNEQTPLSKMNTDPVQNEHHLVYPSSKATESSKINRSDASASSGATAETSVERVERLQKTVREKSVAKSSEHFAKTHSVASFENLWKHMVTSEYGRLAYIGFTHKDKKNAKIFFEWCTKCEVDPLDFVNWCVSNWGALRDAKMIWAELGTNPNISAILGLKERFLEHYRESQYEAKPTAPSARVFTSVDQIPTDHPQFDQLKSIVEKLGRVELL